MAIFFLKKPKIFTMYIYWITQTISWHFFIIKIGVWLLLVTGCRCCPVYLDGNWLWVEDCVGREDGYLGTPGYPPLIHYTGPPLTVINYPGMLSLSDIADIMQTQIVTPPWLISFLSDILFMIKTNLSK